MPHQTRTIPHQARTIDELVETCANKGVEVLTAEGRILLHLGTNGKSRIKELMFASGCSYRGFYLALERLKSKRMVRSQTDPHDRRARIIELA